MINTGLLSATRSNHDAVTVQGAEYGRLTPPNRGEIVSAARGDATVDEADDIRNAGAITGEAFLSGGADVLRDNGGEVHGDVDMGGVSDRVLDRDGAIYGDLALGAGDDLPRGGEGSTVERRIFGGDGDDGVFGGVFGGDGEDTVEAGGGNDRIPGLAGDDVPKGGAGLDLIVGGAGDDEMAGGSQSDVFRIGRHSVDDVVVDVQNDLDVVDLARLAIAGAGKLALVQAAAHDIAGGSIIDLGGDGSLELRGLSVAQYGVTEFLFREPVRGRLAGRARAFPLRGNSRERLPTAESADV